MPLRDSIIAKTVLPIADRLRGTSALQRAKFLENSQWWKTSQIKEYQLEKLRTLISHAYQNVPYYHRVFKERGLQPSDIKQLDDITQIPILTKQDVRKHHH